MLEAIYLRLRKIEVERVTVVEFGVDTDTCSWHSMLYSCVHMLTVGVRGLITYGFLQYLSLFAQLRPGMAGGCFFVVGR